jgi:hypothetical protein
MARDNHDNNGNTTNHHKEQHYQSTTTTTHLDNGLQRPHSGGRGGRVVAVVAVEHLQRSVQMRH